MEATEKGKFIVSVDDGYCEWSYELELPNALSIHDIMEEVCAALKVPLPDGTCRRSYKLDESNVEE